jgi:hypothetical protein
MLKDNIELAIATPGDRKMQMAGGLFRQLWREAAAALAEADEVFFIGFRFPPSDAYPRDRLLGALRNNHKPSRKTTLVLGPDDTPDRQRVIALLEWSTGTKAAINLLDGDGFQGRLLNLRTVWAEDYLFQWANDEARRTGRQLPKIGP